jgi:hypothetical protein
MKRFILVNTNDECTWVRNLHCTANDIRHAIDKWEEEFGIEWVEGGSIYEEESWAFEYWKHDGFTISVG